MKKFVILALIILGLWFLASYFIFTGSTCGFCVVLPGNFAKSEYSCIGKTVEQTSTYMDGGNTIRCVGLAIPPQKCYYFTEFGNFNALEKQDCK